MIHRKGRFALSTADRYRLHPRAQLVPTSSLVTSGLGLAGKPTDVVVGVVGARSASLLISAELAQLLELFRRPTTLAEALKILARRRGFDVHALLENAWPALEEIRRQGILEPHRPESSHEPEAPDVATARPLFAGGEGPIEGLTVIETVHQLEDSEVFLVRLDDGRRGALKVEKRTAGAGSLTREVAALERLNGRGAPRLISRGRLDVGPWLLRGWVDGCDALRAGFSARLEDRALGAGGVRLLALLQRVARAYATLHGDGVLHGDVHAGNVLVDGDGGVWLIDLALATGLGEPLAGEDGLRAGSLFHVEPEQARALLDGRGSIPTSPRGEQFAVAALLYEIASGASYMELRLDRDGLMRQIADCSPLPFTDRGRDPWPALETVLGRALHRDPERRFPSMAAFAEALERLPPQRPRRPPRRRLPIVARRGRRRLRLLTEVAPNLGPSVYDGAAGGAYALLRLADQLSRPMALAAAETWLSEAHRRPVPPPRRARIGQTSVFYCEPGVSLVDALMGHALGDDARLLNAVSRFLDTSRGSSESDLLLGSAGSLLAASFLLELCHDTPRRATQAAALRRRGDAWARTLGAEHRRRGALVDSSFWGMAHGWAGELYALLAWSKIRGAPIPRDTAVRLDELAALARPRGRGRIWPQPGPGPRASWCHGSAGYVFLWHAAARHPATRRRRVRRFQDLARLAAWDAFEDRHDNGTLCCGLAGRAWSLLHHARCSGEDIWRHRAAALAESAASAPFPDPPTSLFKGELALVLLDAELRSTPYGFPLLWAAGQPDAPGDPDLGAGGRAADDGGSQTMRSVTDGFRR
ncbi:MAG: lanthionine synthetase LanC family protein [Acidobacteriota bacterium]